MKDAAHSKVPAQNLIKPLNVTTSANKAEHEHGCRIFACKRRLGAFLRQRGCRYGSLFKPFAFSLPSWYTAVGFRATEGKINTEQTSPGTPAIPRGILGMWLRMSGLPLLPHPEKCPLRLRCQEGGLGGSNYALRTTGLGDSIQGFGL